MKWVERPPSKLTMRCKRCKQQELEHVSATLQTTAPTWLQHLIWLLNGVGKGVEKGRVGTLKATNKTQGLAPSSGWVAMATAWQVPPHANNLPTPTPAHPCAPTAAECAPPSAPPSA